MKQYDLLSDANNAPKSSLGIEALWLALFIIIAITLWLVVLPWLQHSVVPRCYAYIADECDDEFKLLLTLRTFTQWRRNDRIEVLFNMHSPTRTYALEIANGKLRLSKRLDGREQVLIGPMQNKIEPRQRHIIITLRRRLDEIAILLGHRLFTTILDDTFKGGAVAYLASSPRLLPTPIRYQPTECITSSDDFTRDVDEPDRWDKLSGTWKLCGYDSKAINPERSANPFTYEGRTGKRAIAITGYWFWDNYV
ncbi:MAG TPA: hypothetical protein EYP10_11575, partial [Armatimonadetes bacterium]|nr:hypothetical protein [Armatimonadota bacterium]